MSFSHSAPVLSMLSWLGALAALAQYPGHVQQNEAKKPAEPRAVSILEWIGDPGKPVASRIVPLSVFIDGEYQDGGLYLAQPAPLTVETDTLYQLEQAGVPKGTFSVDGGEEVGGAWFGYGKWKPPAPPKPVKKLAPSKVPPKVVQDNDPDRPHFKGGDSASKSSGESSKSTADSKAPAAAGGSAPADDPDKPTIHRRSDAGGDPSATGSSSSGNSSQKDNDKPTLHRRSSDSNQSASGPDTAADDPDRPHLRKQSAAAAGEDGAPVSSVNEADPDRPKLSRGAPAVAQVPLEATKLAGLPANLQQMAAISDSAVREEHAFSYPWPDPAEAARMQAAIEQLAMKAVLAGNSGAGAPIGPATPPPAPPARPPTRIGGARSTLARGVAPRPLPVVLTEKDFRAFELAYNGGATLVFAAKASIGPNNAGVTLEKYVTIVAQPDFNGDPQIRFQSVTDAQHLDITPRMRLIDAVDADGDNRAELIFELRRAADRQFAIYKVTGIRAEQTFATEALPYVAPSHKVETKPN